MWLTEFSYNSRFLIFHWCRFLAVMGLDSLESSPLHSHPGAEEAGEGAGAGAGAGLHHHHHHSLPGAVEATPPGAGEATPTPPGHKVP